jgi:Reverse transcriptase (RNA-dependent DNA polymerase)
MLLHIGFVSSTFDLSLFLFQHANDIAFLLVYVDDIILTGNNLNLLQSIIHLLDQSFTIKDLGENHFFLGIEVHHHDNALLLTQSKYIYSILDKAKMQGAKLNSTPVATGKLLSKFDGAAFEDPYLFLQYNRCLTICYNNHT